MLLDVSRVGRVAPTRRRMMAAALAVLHERQRTLMSNSEIEIVVDDPTAPEADSPAVTSIRVVDVTVSLLLLALAATLGFDNWRTGIAWDSTGPQSGYFPFYLSVILAGASLYGIVAAFLSRKEAARNLRHPRAAPPRHAGVRSDAAVLPRRAVSRALCRELRSDRRLHANGRKIALWKSLLTAFVFTAIMFVTFDIAFDVIMPKGPLEAALGR